MAVADTRPADFKAFWDSAKAKLAKIPLDAKEGPMQTLGPKEINDYNLTSACLPPDYDPDGHRAEQVESCKVDFAGPDGGRVYGWLARPAGKGPFPAMLVLPGAGFAARSRTLEHARHGYVTLVDPMNYAPDIHCPVLMNAGLIDPVSPPYGVWAVYNRLGTTAKEIVDLDGHAHDWSAEFDRRAWRWLDGVWGTTAGKEPNR
jgi:cephalosporin-C deacetylase-like acetyl esterase